MEGCSSSFLSVTSDFGMSDGNSQGYFRWSSESRPLALGDSAEKLQPANLGTKFQPDIV